MKALNKSWMFEHRIALDEQPNMSVWVMADYVIDRTSNVVLTRLDCFLDICTDTRHQIIPLEESFSWELINPRSPYYDFEEIINGYLNGEFQLDDAEDWGVEE